MTGPETVEILNKILRERGIKKGEFYKMIGLSANTHSNWAKGGQPKVQNLEAIEKCLNIRLSDYEKCGENEKLATKSVTSLDVSGLSQDQQDLIRLVLRLNPQEVSLLLSQVKGIIFGN